jgi:hypothetical protein
MLAHAVEFVDGGAARQQQLGGGLFFRQRDRFGRQRQQRRPAAGDQAQNQVALARLSGDLGDARRARDTRLVRQRMAARVELDAAQFRCGPVLYVHQAGGDAPPQGALRGQRHRRAGLARAHHVDIAEARKVAAAKMAQDGVHRIGRGQRRFKMDSAWRRRRRLISEEGVTGWFVR